VRLCLDNYGMGHSLFALMARVPLDSVRVDLKALAGRDDDSDRALQVLSAIVRTTKDFDLTVIAGGISSPAMRDAAIAIGATLLHGRALPHHLNVTEVAALLAVPAL
jgi:EAL domain-containing protein (putative c-di-GMP-specific phosphodiesterase class I)